jgi:cytochrome c oxidase subunit I
LPLLLGAKDVAFPRLNLASWYIYMIGAIMAILAMVTGSVDTGWTFYTPYSTSTGGAVVLMTMAIFVLGFSSIFTGLNFVVTIHKLRAPGMSWFKMPLIIWGLYATAIIQILATPILGITLILLALERVFGIGIFDPAMGGDPVLFQHFFWFYSHPAVYIMILPAMGVISEIIPVFSHKKIFGYKAIAYSSFGIAFISFLVWGHHMFVSGQSPLASIMFSFLTFMVAIPSGIKVFNWIATMYKGSISLKTPMLYALAFLCLFTMGGLSGLFLGALAVDVHLTGTYFIVAHFHYVMFGGTVMAFMGGLHYWWPKMFGKMFSELWAKVALAFIFVGFNITFFTQFILGAKGMPRRYYNYLDQYQPLHYFSTIGSWIMAVGFIIVAIYLIHSLFKGKPAGKNPWGGLTFEWTTSSPPPTDNFPEQPVLTHGPYDYDTVAPESA